MLAVAMMLFSNDNDADDDDELLMMMMMMMMTMMTTSSMYAPTAVFASTPGTTNLCCFSVCKVLESARTGHGSGRGRRRRYCISILIVFFCLFIYVVIIGHWLLFVCSCLYVCMCVYRLLLPRPRADGPPAGTMLVAEGASASRFSRLSRARSATGVRRTTPRCKSRNE